MNDAQRTVLGVAAAFFVIVLLFFAPWRLDATGDIVWGPLYRQPMSYATTYANLQPGARYVQHEASLAVGYYLLELAAIALVGWLGYRVAEVEDGSENDRDDASSL